MALDIDIVIFIAFLVINLFVGLAYGREVKTISDYSLGGRNFSTAALVSTIVATFVTGSAFFVTLSKT
jgi:Na+/proline symporter